MKTIAITQRLIENKDYKEIREALDIRWGTLFNELNWNPIIIPANYPIDKLFSSQKIDGLILSSGNDLTSVNDNELSSIRDTFEKKCIEIALQKNIAILGVCRGLQLVNEYFGGTLKKINKHIGTKHSLKIQSDSKYLKNIKAIDFVNSYHEYGIAVLGDGLIISAISEDGTIEAIEHNSKKIFSIMWHPERENPFLQSDIELLKSYFS